MIRAVFRDGVIYPLEPVPQDWADGQQLRVEPTDSQGSADVEEGDQWLREMDELTAELNDPAAWDQLEKALTEADQQAKAVPPPYVKMGRLATLGRFS